MFGSVLRYECLNALFHIITYFLLAVNSSILIFKCFQEGERISGQIPSKSPVSLEAVNQILNHAGNPNLTATKIIVPHALVERSSCKTLEI